MSPRLFRVVVPVSSIETAKTFYTQLLGMPGRRVSPGHQYYNCGGTVLDCFDPNADGESFPARPNPDYISIAVDNLEAVYGRAVEAACTWLEEMIRTRPSGERSFRLQDPFGNPLCFVDETTMVGGDD